MTKAVSIWDVSSAFSARSTMRRHSSFLAKRLLAFALALVSLFLPASGFPMEYSGEEFVDLTGTSGLSHLTTKWELLSAQLRGEVCHLRDEQFTNTFNLPVEQMGTFSLNKIDLPQITIEDGCFKTNFNKEKCLGTIAKGLQEYQLFKQHVKESFVKHSSKVEDVWNRMKHLSDDVIQRMKNSKNVAVIDEHRKELLLNPLQSDKQWDKYVGTHVILRELTRFMEKSVRAIRYISSKS
ncbi:IL6 protein, partial [Polypterus senegalus]|nr:interleukin-6 [Polypterus senegalus]MBN3289183.1 IL6 protein [Polypterus senegalus]